MSQHIATWWPNEHNMLRSTVLRYVALTCCDRLAGALRNSLVIMVLSPGQTIATFQLNYIVGRNMLRAFGRRVATCWVLLAQV